MDKLLEYFGIMRIKKARSINTQILSVYERGVANYVRKDFGIPPTINHDEVAIDWANEVFDQMMDEWKPDAVFVCSWEW